MSINFTLIGQMITFFVFVWFCMRYVWPPIQKALHERQAKIAAGLEASDRGHRELELAQHRATEVLRAAKLEASQLIERANKRSVEILEEAKETARAEGQQILTHAKEEMAQMLQGAKAALQKEFVALVSLGAERILEKEVDAKTHQHYLDDLIEKFAE